MKQLKTNDFYSNNRRNNKFCKLDGYCTCYGNMYKFNRNCIDKDNTINDNNKSINSPKDVDHIPLKDLIFRSPSELFSLRKQCLIDYETSKCRKNWLCVMS